MVKRIAFGLFFLTMGWVEEILGQNVFSNRNWTWISGSNIGSAAGVYGTLGVESLSNTPPARYSHSMVYHPLTKSIYIMHGVNSVSNRFSDVWRFNLTSNRWTWIGGTSTMDRVSSYGTKGTAALSNVPGSRDGYDLVADANGFLYCFGGEGYDTSTTRGYLNDLWRYDISTNWFTWLSGSNTRNQLGSYGTQGVEASSNIPGGRGYSGAVYHQRTNSIYVYGGTGYDSVGPANLNDLWRYNVTSGMWAWIHGATSGSPNAVFNTVNVESVSTTPGASYQFGMTIAPNNDAIYQFGSYRTISGALVTSNALFRYNITTNRWAWIAGSTSASPTSNYGTINVEASTNALPPKLRSTMSYHPASNHLIVSGDNQNDLWRFNLASNMWAWIQGTSAANVGPNYGTLGVSASTNRPGNRLSPRSVINPDSNTFFLFGGVSFFSSQALGDLWQYVIDTAPLVVTTTSTSTTTSSTTTTTTTSSTTTTTTTTSTTITTTTTSTTPTSTTTIFLTSVGNGALSSSSTISPKLTIILSTFISEGTSVEETSTLIQPVPTSPFTNVTPISTDSPTAPGPASSSSLLIYAGAGAAVALLLIAVAVTVYLIRRRSASKGGNQQVLTPVQDYQNNGAYSTQSIQPSTQFTSLMTEQSMYSQNPMMNTIGRQAMFSQPMSQQYIPMGMGIPMNTNAPMGFPTNSNLNMGWNGYISGSQKAMIQVPAVNNGQGAGTMMVDEYETPRNYNQFQY